MEAQWNRSLKWFFEDAPRAIPFRELSLGTGESVPSFLNKEQRIISELFFPKKYGAFSNKKIWDELSSFIPNHYTIDDELTLEVVKMAQWAHKYGLSLGDRYCLALGAKLDLPIYTADKIWKSVEKHLDVKIYLIR